MPVIVLAQLITKNDKHLLSVLRQEFNQHKQTCMQQQAMSGKGLRGLRTEQVPGSALMSEFPVIAGRIRRPDSQEEYDQKNDYQWQAHAP
ncbi:hypothetical protein Lrub_0602 [Legionella rubrilucens]|uniref:Uncharacterized protein n=1 Tax=Legionella rubrilucens TaxID=458 RepID=A0A0W0XYG6_9GAMM|nr:hypothetical protein Lrub_0602 [Legionella rubrilucens]